MFLFIGFYAGNTAFLHTHYFGSYSVTHSHPYSKNAKGEPNHSHSQAAINLIAQFNAFVIDVVPILSVGMIAISIVFTFIRRYRSVIVRRAVGSRGLRAPPVPVI